jgi:hypothetical protein
LGWVSLVWLGWIGLGGWVECLGLFVWLVGLRLVGLVWVVGFGWFGLFVCWLVGSLITSFTLLDAIS